MRLKLDILYDYGSHIFKLNNKTITTSSNKDRIKILQENNIKNFIGHFKTQSIEKRVFYTSFSECKSISYACFGFSIKKEIK